MIKCLKSGCPVVECLRQSAGQLYNQVNGIAADTAGAAFPALRILTGARPRIPVATRLCLALTLAVVIISGYHGVILQKNLFRTSGGTTDPSFLSQDFGNKLIKPETSMRTAASAADLINQLKKAKLWNLPTQAVIPPVLFSGFPDNLHLLEVDIKKRVFLHTMLPVIMTAQAEVKNERDELLEISRKIETGLDKINDLEANDLLSAQEISFLRKLGGKYKAQTTDELLDKVNIFPASMILAQSAIESSWGTSRFTRQGNNLFGVWTWGERGMVPARREAGKSHKVAIYDSILDSVKAYMLILNKMPAYKRLRYLRAQTMNPVTLARGLRLYSERKDEYVSDVQQVIVYNGLQKYDQVRLAPGKTGRTTLATINTYDNSKIRFN